MPSTIGSSARPLSVSEYSTRGGTSGYVWRSTIPSYSSARRRGERVRGLMPASDRSSSQKREQPSARSRTSSNVHFPHTISAVLQTGHVSSTAIPTLYQLKQGRTTKVDHPSTEKRGQSPRSRAAWMPRSPTTVPSDEA